jgi:OmpA-OmpF porin, OOP family
MPGRQPFLSLGLSVALTLAGAGLSSAGPLDLDADECMIQRALLGRAAADCPPPPEPPRPSEPPALAVPSPPSRNTPPPVAAAPAPSPAKLPSPVAAAPPAPAPPAPAAPAPVTAPVTAERTADFLILFDFGSNRISRESEALLTRIAAVMNAPSAAGLRFHLIGHTDGVGSAAANQALSQRRAEAVKTWLAQKGGVAATRLEASGMGKSKLADPAHPAAAANRRVEIVVRPTGGSAR